MSPSLKAAARFFMGTVEEDSGLWNIEIRYSY